MANVRMEEAVSVDEIFIMYWIKAFNRICKSLWKFHKSLEWNICYFKLIQILILILMIEQW